jgi:hypothetical protein
MLRRLAALSTVLAVLASVGCQKSGPVLLRDTEKRTFEATCPSEGPCKLEQKSGNKRPDKPAQSLLLGGRLVGICDVTDGQAPAGPFDCRPLDCQSNSECPPLHGMKEGQCVHNRCSDPSEAVSAQDAIMLCLAGTGLGRETPAQIERYALALNCGTPCRVPAPCQQL